PCRGRRRAGAVKALPAAVSCSAWSGLAASLPELLLVLLHLPPAEGERLLQRFDAQTLICVTEKRPKCVPAPVTNHDRQRPMEPNARVPPDPGDPLHVVAPAVRQLPEVEDCRVGPPCLPRRSGRGEDVLGVRLALGSVAIRPEVADYQELGGPVR